MTQIDITFLGTTAGIPTKARNHAALYVKYKSENEFCYLFDCGEGTQRQMLFAGLNFMRINEIFITHWHADHFAGLLGLIESMNLEDKKTPLTIFAPEAEKFVTMLLDLGYSTKNFSIVPKNVEFEGNQIHKLLETKEFVISTTPVKHGIPAVAYSFQEKPFEKTHTNTHSQKKAASSKLSFYKNVSNKFSFLFFKFRFR